MKIFTNNTAVCSLLILIAVSFSGCGTKTPSGVKKAEPQAPVLAPMPAYPPEKTGWKTNVPLMLLPTTGNLNTVAGEVRKALQVRQYILLDPPQSDADWLSVEWRKGAKLIIVSFATGYSSPVFKENRSSDICLQVQVIDQRAYDGVNVDSAAPNVRTFHVWSRQKHPANLDVKAVYVLHAPELAKNLMCLPGFREALQ